GGELLAALPQRQRLFEAGAAGLEFADHLDKFLAGLLVCHLGSRVTHLSSSALTSTAKRPSLTRACSRSPGATCATSRTAVPSASCSTEYPRSRVAFGDSARTLASRCAMSSLARSSR